MAFADQYNGEGETCVGMTDGDCYSQLSEYSQDNLYDVLVETIRNYFTLKRGCYSPIECSKTNQYSRDMRFLIQNWEVLLKMNQWFEQLMGARMSIEDITFKRMMNEMKTLFHQAMHGIFPDQFPVKAFNHNVSLLTLANRLEEMIECDIYVN